MGRKPRIWLPGVTYHVVSRGNWREELFRDEQDIFVFFELLDAVAEKVTFEMYAYCLMKNHFHLMLSTSEEPLSKLMALLNKRYADYYNNRYSLSGHLFEKRYYSGPIKDEYGFLQVSRYIHRNPVEANLVKSPSDYPWSSYRCYVKSRWQAPRMVDTNKVLSRIPGDEESRAKAYKKYVEKVEKKLVIV
ncbi:transposase [Microaerobacter geothermalis]|uniref:transposase n=1 Tax=Microaerobacter geothermalis TaxID=674972 RepID=UPI001F257CF4|nr:transposase [Microaerobacter geothermalis]MCF6093283.1 transposase [Microaerobacter geothermalis]